MNDPDCAPEADVVLIGAGIMSVTLGFILKELDPNLRVELLEALPGPAQESSGGWNNAGTGHAGNCELTYTGQRPDGSVDISKALKVNVEFEQSRQLWTYLVKKGVIADPATFIHPVPHISFVRGVENVAFLKKRFEAMSGHHCYSGMEYTQDRTRLSEWMPLVMEGRAPDEPVAATRIAGADVDFGALTRALIAHLQEQEGFRVRYSERVLDIRRHAQGGWLLRVGDAGGWRQLPAKFVYVGAGGGALPLLQSAGIPEIRGYGGFPVSGLWLRCTEPRAIERHDAKVYGKAALGTPPMSVPHLDTRFVGGQRALLFGPYAGFSTNFLKKGSYWDFILSLRPGNIVPMLAVARDNVPLTRYLIEQVLQSPRRRFSALQEYYPLARRQDWQLVVAGQRVQIIKPDARRGGRLEFGTELVASADRSIVGLLGASPGASTAAHIAIDVLETCFAQRLKDSWLPKLKQIVPGYGAALEKDARLWGVLRQETAARLGLQA